MKLLLTLALVLVVLNSHAADFWPKGAKLAYVDRCAASMNSQGLPMKNAKGYCACVSNGMEAEFGMKEYDQMMKANPNPGGNDYDRRLYTVLMACKDHLPN